MRARLERGQLRLRRCAKHQLLLQSDGKCALCRAPEDSGGSRTLLYIAGAAACALFGFLIVDRGLVSSHAARSSAAETSTSARVTPASEPSRRALQAEAQPEDAVRTSSEGKERERLPAEDQFLRTPPLADQKAGASPAPPRAFVEPEPSLPDNPQDFIVSHGERDLPR
jgi:hypothetical protein